MKQKLHHSLFLCEDKDGDAVLIDLSKITYITVDKNCCHFVTLSNNECVPLSGIDGDRLVEAWNTYKAIEAAKPLVSIPEIHNKTIAVQSAIRLDSSLEFFVKQEAEA